MNILTNANFTQSLIILNLSILAAQQVQNNKSSILKDSKCDPSHKSFLRNKVIIMKQDL